MSVDRRTLNRLATRQKISNVATRLFLEKGFEQVTIDEIATEAEVGRMTVFNHFPRKEEMFFDREEEGLEMLRCALSQRDKNTGPLEALRRFAHHLVEQNSPVVAFSVAGQGFVSTIDNSPALKARAREIRDEFTQALAHELAAGAGLEKSDPQTQLAAGLVLATWSAALIQAHRTFSQTLSNAAAAAVFLELIDRGTAGVIAAMNGTVYGEK
ncbi:TetR/AcrR family transcriptional regulator [Cedecea neteri]|uniref:TetR/AcrR family transcriptional regulator n=1 Tax=Cedecea neteri TaxID=158822 RepID=UPI00289943C0|nr:TetR/AcrR family transcriptional regulator [Cedecea neteri]